MDNVALRERIGQAARAEILARHTTDALAPRWQAWYEAARAGVIPEVEP